MRASFFGWLLKHLETHPVKIINRFQLLVLFRCTCKGFGVKPRGKGLRLLFSRDALLSYAAVSKDLMDHYKDLEARMRLFKTAYTLGRRIRRITGFTDPRQLRSLVFLLYRNIGITMTGELPGDVLVTRCAFAQIYSPQECSRMSAMDSGMISGIFGGGELKFTERLTEGCAACKACFSAEESRK